MPVLSSRRPAITAFGVALTLLSSLSAHAQTADGGIALNQFDPSPAGDRFFSLPSPHVAGHLVPRGVVVFDYAYAPLVVNAGQTSGAIVSAQAFLHVGASFALWNRLLVHAQFPLAVMQQGDSPTLAGIKFPSPSGFDVGDLRLGARIRLYGDENGPLAIAAGASVHLPTGRAEGYAGEGGVRVVPELLLGGQVWRITWAAAVRPVFRTSNNPATFQYAAGASILLADRIQVGPEFHASTPIQEGFIRVGDGKAISRGVETNAEVLVGVRGRVVADLWLGAAAGPGLSSAIGTPVFRALGMITWSPSGKPAAPAKPPPATDTDADGIRDTDDACPNAFGPPNDNATRNGCPVLDRDEDGVIDSDDICPDEFGSDTKRRGCPVDRDADGVQDSLDLCPDAAGDAASHGCSPKI